MTKRQHKTLDMIWPECEVYCLCCETPLLIVPDAPYLACRWSGDVFQIGDWGRIIQVSGPKILPCPACHTPRLKEARQIVNGVCHRRQWCACGFVSIDKSDAFALDFLPTDYVIEWLEPPLDIQAKRQRHEEIKQAVREILEEIR